MAKLRVLVVDDSALVRRALCAAIMATDDMEVAGTAADPFEAREKILALEPDVLTLDLEMPKMGGLSFLRQLMQHHPLPVIVISSLTGPSCEATFEALRLGAVDVMAKPNGSYSVGRIGEDLPVKLRAAALVRPHLRARIATPDPVAPSAARSPARSAAGSIARPVPPSKRQSDPPSSPSLQTAVPGTRLNERQEATRLIAIGASTGGTEAIAQILVALPADTPALVITQHIPAGFSLAFANRLNRLCAFEVKEAVDGDEVMPGRALIAPGDFHMVVARTGSRLHVRVIGGPQVCYQRPSVDVMFRSVAQAMQASAIGVLLTGMGADGAAGLLAMRQEGAATIAQDERTSVVFGMPKEAIRLGAAVSILGLPLIAEAIQKGVLSLPRHAAAPA